MRIFFICTLNPNYVGKVFQMFLLLLQIPYLRVLYYQNNMKRSEQVQSSKLALQGPSKDGIRATSKRQQKLNYSVYFHKGNDERVLSINQQQQIVAIMDGKAMGTSILVYNSEEVKRKYRNFCLKFPWIKVHYAIMANPVIPLVQDLVQYNSNFACVSKTQIEKLLQLGVNVQKIVYSNSIKDQEDIQWANDIGIKLTTADTIDQLLRLQKYAPSIGILWRISVRQEQIGNLSASNSLKCGDDLKNQRQIKQRMRQIHNIGISLKGIHFHCKSQHHGSLIGKAIILARECLRIGRQFNHEMSILNIGGGFPAGQLSLQTIQALQTTENDALSYKVYAQPGRHICANAFYLLTKVLGKRQKSGKTCYHLNQSTYQSFHFNIINKTSFQSSNIFYGCINSDNLSQKKMEQKIEGALFGMTCDGIDIIAKRLNVPRCVKISDWICLSGMGAYIQGSKTSFNGMKAAQKIIKWRSNANYQQPKVQQQDLKHALNFNKFHNKQARENERKDFSLFFLTGKDHRFLSESQQKQILNFLVCKKYNTSVMVYNSRETIRKIRNWKEKLPWIKVFYAVKANPTQAILKDLIDQGSNFDCASKYQIQLLLNLGVKPERLIYSNSVKQQADLQFASNHKVNLTTADTIQQLQKILKYAPDIKVLWRIAIKQQQTDKLSCIFSEKFGDDLTNDQEIRQRMNQIKRIGINLKGIHFHCGSGHYGSSGFSKGIPLARLYIKIGRQCGHDMQILDIGGGYPGGQLNQKLIDVLKTTQNDPLKYQVIAEPGENLAKTSFYLLTKVIGKKQTKSGQNNYYLNDSIYHSFFVNSLDVQSLWDVNRLYSSINTKNNQPQQVKGTQISSLFGMTSDQNDVIARNVSVPIDLNTQDWFCLSGMGAYYYTTKSQFCGFKATDFIIEWNADVHNNKKLQLHKQPKIQSKKEYQIYK